MERYKAENAQPNPKSTINSYRSFGYNLSTAIADIVDNSISANADFINIDYFWEGQDSYISIFDNGNGMNLKDLIIAMTPGSKDPDEIRSENDLGRFGMGLKTASFSQCKRLTVITKKKGYSVIKRCWDIDFINKVEEWTLLDYVSNNSFIEKVESYDSGTIVLWENLDRIVGNAKKNNESVKNAFYQEMLNVKEHLGLVFHRFIENKRVQLKSNSYLIDPWNPFLYNLGTKPEMGATEKLAENVVVTYYILPHMSRITIEEYEKSGGPLGWFNQQGFYIYRGDRLLVSGDWLGLEKKRDYSKLARIAVNFPNTGDFGWNLDIKKSTATPPIEIRKELSRIAKIAIKKSALIYNWRGQKTSNGSEIQGFEWLWNDEINRDGIKKYKINRKHPMIKELLESNKVNKLFSKTLKLLEENIPLELILYNQNEDASFHELEKITEIPSDDLINLAKDLYKINISKGVPSSLARQQIMNSIPFNHFPLINDYLK